MVVIISNESLAAGGIPVFTLVPNTLYHMLPLEQLCNNTKYSVVTKIPGVPFSNENSSYSLRCCTFVQNINWPSDAFYNKELQRSIYSVDTQGGNIHDFNIKNACEIMRSVKSITNHSSIVTSNIVRNTTIKSDIIEASNFITNTTFNGFFNSLITNSNTIIDSATAIIDSAKAINKSAREIIYNASFNVHKINKAANVTHDTTAYASNNLNKITRNATRVIRNSNDYNNHGFSIYGSNVHSVNIHNANEIKSTANRVISEANKMISEANNDINLAKGARKRFAVDKALTVCEPSHSLSSWESIIVPVAYTTITLTVCTMSAYLCKSAWLFFN